MTGDRTGYEYGGLAAGWRRGLAWIAATLAVALLIAIIALVGVTNQKRDAALSRQRHSYEVLIVIRDFDAAMARAEAALARFAISGEDDNGRAYFQQWSLAGQRLTTLTNLTMADPIQRPLVARTRALYALRGRELAGPARSAAAGEGWSALTLFDRTGKANSLKQVSQVVETISINERRMLTDLSANAARSVKLSNLMAGLLSVLGILLVLIGLMLARLALRAMRARREAGRRADVEADRAGTLERAVAERTRELQDANERLHAEALTRASTEAQLHQAQKMDAIGQLTGGIAHDFNNMLAIIVGGLELAKRRLPYPTPDVVHHLNHALDGAGRAAALTKRLLAFARAEPLRPEDVDAGDLVRDMLELLDRTLGERVQIQTSIRADGWLIWCDPHQLENTLLNLALNARDASRDGGNVLIVTDNVRLKMAEVGDLAAGDYLRIDVRDDGCGMEKAVLERAFEPFFTTKAVGKGTGLGLSQIFGFVRQSSGEVVILSEPGEGTCVSLFLPRYTGKTRRNAVPATTTPNVREAKGETILVVEDDPRVRMSTVDALEELGYCPLPCASGLEALAALAERADVSLVISDVVMPGMSGPELVDRIRAERSEIACIFVTGYVGDSDNGDRLRGQDVLRKPFTMAGLARAVATALDGCRNAERAA